MYPDNQNVPSLTPYLIRSVLDYCRDTDMTPYVMVAVDEACSVPEEYVQDGRIVFDISDEAVHLLDITRDWLTFQARFGEANTIFAVAVPVNRIIAVTPLEHQELALQFEVKPTPASLLQEEAETPTAKPAPAPRFSRVK